MRWSRHRSGSAPAAAFQNGHAGGLVSIIEGGAAIRLTEVSQCKVKREHIAYSAQLIFGSCPCLLGAKGRRS